jgi:hypothetical protein
MVAARTLLALFVTWGTVVEMARTDTFIINYWTLPAPPPNCKYTVARQQFTFVGWPLVFYSDKGPPGWVPRLAAVRPVALVCDLVVFGVRVVAGWNLPGRCRRQFSLADLLAVTTSVALTLSFHLVAWKHRFEFSLLAIDIGVFSVAVTFLGAARKLTAMVLRWRSRRPDGSRQGSGSPP